MADSNRKECTEWKREMRWAGRGGCRREHLANALMRLLLFHLFASQSHYCYWCWERQKWRSVAMVFGGWRACDHEQRKTIIITIIIQSAQNVGCWCSHIFFNISGFCVRLTMPCSNFHLAPFAGFSISALIIFNFKRVSLWLDFIFIIPCLLFTLRGFHCFVHGFHSTLADGSRFTVRSFIIVIEHLYDFLVLHIARKWDGCLFTISPLRFPLGREMQDTVHVEWMY